MRKRQLKSIKQGNGLRLHYDRKVDLHCMKCTEAERHVSEYIRRMRKGGTLLIIHGKGSGILSSHIRNFLKNHFRVKKIILGENSGLQGGSGVTAAILNPVEGIHGK